MNTRRIAATAAVGVLVCLGANVGGVRAAAASAQPLTQLPLDVVPGLSSLTPTGATPASTPVELDIALQDSNASTEQSWLNGLYDPHSTYYHQFLTPDQFATHFGANAAEYEAALGFATSHGLSVVRTSPARDLIVLRGTVAQAETTFAVTIDNYTWKGLNFYANTAAPSVPAGIGIVGVIGLNSAQAMHVDQSDCVAGVCAGITTPEDLWSAYGMPSNDEGQGQKLAIFGEGDWTPPLQDLRDFEANPDQLTTCGGSQGACSNALPKVPVRVLEVDGTQAQYTDTAGDEEWDIDTQASTGMAPQVQELDLYFGTNLSDADVLNVANDWANDTNGPEQASASYGECEYDPASAQLPPSNDFAAGQAFTVAYEQAMQQANMEGRQLFSSSGDNGSSCPVTPVNTNGVITQAFPDVNYPCSSPEVICVGGTKLYTTGASPNARALEESWEDSGGGTSALFHEPTWQTGAQPSLFPCAYNDQGQPDTSGAPCRGVPDIAAQSGDIETNGYDIYYDGSPTEQGGTSLSSPLSLGMWTRIQAASTKTHGNGPAGPVLYGAAAATTGAENINEFYDVGNAGESPPSAPTTNGYFDSAPGWDYVSGLGVMNVKNLTTMIDGTTTPSDDVPSPNTGTITYYDGVSYALIPAAGPVDPACVPLFTSPGDSASTYPLSGGMDYPYLDVLQGDMHNTAATLTTVMTIKNMQEWANQGPQSGTPPPPGGLEEYYFLWQFGGTAWYTNAQVTATGDTFSYGTYNGTSTPHTYNQVGTINAGPGTGIKDGPDGTITVTVPLSDIGAPSVGKLPSTLTTPTAEVDVFQGTSITGGAGYVADTAGPEYDYTLDEVCAATGLPGSDGGGSEPSTNTPEVPLAVLLPLAGIAALATVSERRRRRMTKQRH